MNLKLLVMGGVCAAGALHYSGWRVALLVLGLTVFCAFSGAAVEVVRGFVAGSSRRKGW